MSENRMQRTCGLVRAVSRSLANCELLHAPRQQVDLDLARQQHRSYVAALGQEGVSVTVLPEVPDCPDATFVEDTVVMLDEVAVICRPGAASRRQEPALMEQGIVAMRAMRQIAAPGTLEGGDVLRIDRTVYVGRSSRTNESGIRQLMELVAPFGYQVVEVPVRGCLHLKTGVTSPAEGLLLINPEWIDRSRLPPWKLLEVPEGEPWGANVLAINGTVLAADSAPRTADLLESGCGLHVRRLGISEFQKAEAGLTCLSVLFRGAGESVPNSK